MVDDPRTRNNRDEQGWCTVELTETVIVCTRPAQVQARKIPKTEKRSRQDSAPNQEAILNAYLLEES